jgi:hypothetical protein
MKGEEGERRKGGGNLINEDDGGGVVAGNLEERSDHLFALASLNGISSKTTPRLEIVNIAKIDPNKVEKCTNPF